jgi:hypothetical protein
MSISTTPIVLQISRIVVEEKEGVKTRAPLVILSQWDFCPGDALPELPTNGALAQWNLHPEEALQEPPDDMVVLAREDALSLARWILGRFSQ